MQCAVCPVALVCLRGDLRPEPCQLCDRIIVGVDEKDGHRTCYAIRCPGDAPTRVTIIEERTEAAICPDCGFMTWQILSHLAGGQKLRTAVLDPRWQEEGDANETVARRSTQSTDRMVLGTHCRRSGRDSED